MFAACFDVCHRAGIRTYLTGGVRSASDQPTEQEDRPFARPYPGFAEAVRT
jgi:hypothetical protein